MSAKKRAKPRRKLATRLHRWLGLGSFAIVLVIALTGVALNHTEALDLDGKKLTSAPILKRYGMQPDGQPSVFKADGRLLALWQGECLFDSKVVDTAPAGASLVAAGRVNPSEFAFVFPSDIIVCDAQGGLLDRLDAASLPEGTIVAAGTGDQQLIVEMSSGESLQLVDWLEAIPVANQNQDITWFAPSEEVTGDQRERLATALRGEGLPLSRVVLDLHSGRFFGALGVLIYDLAAIAMILLGITGVILWLRRR